MDYFLSFLLGGTGNERRIWFRDGKALNVLVFWNHGGTQGGLVIYSNHISHAAFFWVYFLASVLLTVKEFVLLYFQLSTVHGILAHLFPYLDISYVIILALYAGCILAPCWSASNHPIITILHSLFPLQLGMRRASSSHHIHRGKRKTLYSQMLIKYLTTSTK